MAERLALLRSLERIGTARAMLATLALFAHDFEAFRWEARHIVTRVGKRSGPVLLRAAAIAGTSLEVWGKWGQRALGINDPASMIAGQDEATIVEIVRAYAAVNHMGGMPVVADFVDDPREPVRGAAREAMERYGQNGVWQLRRLMEQQLGSSGDRNASWQETMRALYAGLDARRLAPENEALDAALAEAARGAVDDAVTRLDALLARTPVLPRLAEAAPVYARRGDAHLADERWDDAHRAYDRALWLDGSHPEAAVWRASRALAESELAIARGAPEEALLRAALDSPVARERAEARLDGDTPEPATADAEPSRPRVPAAWLAVAGLTLLALPWITRAARAMAAPLAGAAAHVVPALARARTVARTRVEAWRAAFLAARARRAEALAREGARVRPADAALDAVVPAVPEAAPVPVAPHAFATPPTRAEVAHPPAREARVPASPPASETAPKRPRRKKPAPAALPADLVFGAAAAPRKRAPARRGDAAPRPPVAHADPALTTSPGSVTALDTLPG